MTITGGQQLYVTAQNSSSITIRGGSGTQLFAYDDAHITLVGHDFSVNGVPVGYGDVVPVVGSVGGTLASGETTGWAFSRQQDPASPFLGTITLAPIPEPATASLLALGIAVLAAGAGPRPRRQPRRDGRIVEPIAAPRRCLRER